ncbi:toll/interleukin-1 receptor domain-containing protein [Leucobacter sp. NPDC058333]|uniref:toll/interleukin-1 receptor domain-containing protein n=1 Tax=Leucobacter sp. NPDC058333 TaxID=3346450 RepID=UPI0036642A14
MTNIFISWSGEASHAIAKALHTWLPTVLAGTVNCFVSSQDIRRGDRGLDVIASELDSRDYGIVILTRENLKSEWIHFEAGALGKSLGDGKVAPLLVDVTRADVVGPLNQFQSTLLTDKDDMLKFVDELAELSAVKAESAKLLFESQWDVLKKVVEKNVGSQEPATTRSTESMLEEILGIVRDQARSALDPLIVRNALEELGFSDAPVGSLRAKVEKRNRQEGHPNRNASSSIAPRWEAAIARARRTEILGEEPS